MTLNEGSTPLIHSPRLSERVGAEVYLKFEGVEPDRQLQGPGDDRRGLAGQGRRGRGDHLRLDRQHRRELRRLCRARRHARSRDRPGGEDRDRQARPGTDARGPGDRPGGQLRPGARDRPGDRREAPGRAGQLGQPVPDRGPEDRRLRDLRRARRGAGRARHPGRQRRQRHLLVGGLPGVRGFADPLRLPGRRARRRWSRAIRSRSPRPSPRRSGSATRRAGRRR